MQTQTVGWIGTGVMGRSMAGHLLAKGCPMVVYSRTKAAAEALVAAGARWASTPAELAGQCQVVFSMVGTPADVEMVHLGPTGTLRAKALPRVLVDMTTSSPGLAERLAREAAAVGVGSVDAPVSGGDVGARNATLSIMCGGSQADFEAVRPLLEVMGKTIVLQGPPGSGQHTKMVNQILIAGTMLGLGEALSYSKRAGLNPEQVLQSVSGGAAGSWALSNLAPRVLKGDFAPGFAIEHFIKDLGIALAEATRMNLDLPMVQTARATYAALAAAGHSRSGTQSIVKAYHW